MDAQSSPRWRRRWRRLGLGSIVCGLLAGSVGADMLPSFELQNWDGRTITNQDLLGHSTVVLFTYAKCVFACPLATFLLQVLDDDMGNPQGVSYLHISVNPSEDTGEEIRLHFEKHGIDPQSDPRWFFLNGPASGIFSLLDTLGIEVEKKDLEIAGQMGWVIDHTIRVFVIGPAGEIRRTFDSFHWNPEEMRDALQPELARR